MNKNNQNSKFPGFPDPNQSWNFPIILNGYVHILTGAEFKVLWYILRHTYGWQKIEDAISLTQLEEGIIKKSGDFLDKGTGLSRKTIVKAIGGLEKKGFVTIKRTKGGRGLDYINKYAPKLQMVSKGNCLEEQKETVSGIKTAPTIVNNTIFNTQQSEWVKKYGNGITELISRYSLKQVDDAIKITEAKIRRGEKIESPIAYITTLCKREAKWEDTEEAKGERYLNELGEKTKTFLKESN